MIPNEYGLIRQYEHDLIALLYPPLLSLSEYDIEVIQPEYIDGFRYNSNIREANAYTACAVVDLSDKDFDRILLPNYSHGGTSVCGLKTTGSDTAVFNFFATNAHNQAFTEANLISSYICFNHAANYNYAFVNDLIGLYRPIILLKKHRSDNVNPLGSVHPMVKHLTVQDPEEEQEEA